MIKSPEQFIIDGKRIFKATNVKTIHPVSIQLAESLSRIDILKFIKIYNDRLCASNLLSDNGKKEPIVEIGKEDVVGVELLIDPVIKTVQFYSVTSTQKGYGRKMVESVVKATPEDWFLVVPMDWSGGFWKKMMLEYPRIVVF
ncbi:MAG: hypothetical protein NTY00_07855 [Deltaproteobacteria bacterium]|nr:hypothetical protein [Deltaproteobacteria bacterium]